MSYSELQIEKYAASVSRRTDRQLAEILAAITAVILCQAIFVLVCFATIPLYAATVASLALGIVSRLIWITWALQNKFSLYQDQAGFRDAMIVQATVRAPDRSPDEIIAMVESQLSTAETGKPKKPLLQVFAEPFVGFAAWLGGQAVIISFFGWIGTSLQPFAIRLFGFLASVPA